MLYTFSINIRIYKLKKYHSNMYLKTEGEIAWDFMIFCFKKVIKTIIFKNIILTQTKITYRNNLRY